MNLLGRLFSVPYSEKFYFEEKCDVISYASHKDVVLLFRIAKEYELATCLVIVSGEAFR